MTSKTTALFLGFALLAACTSTGGLGSAEVGRSTQPGAKGSAQSSDSLLVGHHLMETGEFEKALKAYLRAAGETGMNADVLSALGSANLKLGRLGQAEQILRRAVEADPKSVPALNNLGVVLMERGKLGEARAVFQQAYAQDSGSSDSIRKNLRLAIAQTDAAVYAEPSEDQTFSLVRRDNEEYVLLSQL